MAHDSPRQQSSPGVELIERPAVTGWMVWPELVRPDPTIRSPIMDPRRRQILPPDPDRTTVMLPAGRDLLGPMTWAVCIALPVLVVIGWQAAVLAWVVTAIVRTVDGRLARSDLSFASGFIGYRGAPEWPRGVREDDDVRWNWSGAQHPGSA
jgi:hypothetical protein